MTPVDYLKNTPFNQLSWRQGVLFRNCFGWSEHTLSCLDKAIEAKNLYETAVKLRSDDYDIAWEEIIRRRSIAFSTAIKKLEESYVSA